MHTHDQNMHQVILGEAFEKFVERDRHYQGLWRKRGWRDSLHHIESKSQRIVHLGQLQVYEHSDLLVAVDDALDLINYSAFLIRNIRDPLPPASRQGHPFFRALRDIKINEEVAVDFRSGTVS